MGISKSNYVKGLFCKRAMWLTKNRPELLSISESVQARIDQGLAVGEAFRQLSPNGQLIYSHGDSIDEAKQLSLSKIESRKSTLFEAVFEYGGVLVIVDVLEPAGDNAWNLVEVKSTSKVKDEHIPDLAIQKWVLEGNGVILNSVNLAHINNTYVGEEGDSLFSVVDLSDQLEHDVSEIVRELVELMASEEQPDVPLGKHCKDCDLEEHCFGGFLGKTIYNIPRISDAKISELESRNVFELEDVPEDFALTDAQRKVVDAQINKTVFVDETAIRQALEGIAFPIYFLDFETVNPAIPIEQGIRPFSKIPFQYSCHQLEENGDLSHFEYLHDKYENPGAKLAEHLANHIGDTGTVMAYSAGFERGVLLGLADQIPELEPQLRSISDRLWDLLPVMRNNYSHYQFGNSYSIKAVLPVLVPDFDYKQLSVQDGAQAGAVWLSSVQTDNTEEREAIFSSLREYCGMDTMAMVMIYKHLLNDIADPGPE